MPITPRPWLVTLPLPEDGPNAAGEWKKRREAAIAAIERDLSSFRANTDSYNGKVYLATAEYDRVVVPKDYSKTERKKASLCFALPQVTLKPLQPVLTNAVAAFQSRLNAELGQNGVDAITAVNAALFDTLCTSGFGVVKIGYEPTVDGEEQVQAGTEQVPAPPSPGAVLNLSAPMIAQPIFRTQPRIVYDRYFFEHVSPAKLLRPTDFRGGDHDKAPWLGVEFLIPTSVAVATFGVPADALHEADADDHLITVPPSGDDKPDHMVKGWEFWYYAACFDPATPHPLRLRHLVFLDGLDDPVVHRDSPYQVFDANGRFVTGAIGHPIKVLTIRTLTDAASPKSDVEMTRPQVKELNRGRTQMLNQRDRNVPTRLGDVERLGGQETVDKINRGEWQAIIPVPGLDPNNPPLQELARASYPPEDFTFDRIVNRDIDEAWGMGANQSGVETSEGKTATEQALVQRNSDARLDKERQLVLGWFAKSAAFLGALIQLFDDRAEMVEVLGVDGEAQLATWDRAAVQGRFVYEVHPDAGQRIDGEKYLKDLMDGFNYLARDPHVQRTEIIRPIVAALKLDPSRVIVPQLPPKGPDPANVSFRFSGDDLDPTQPKFAIIESLLKQSGYTIPPEALADAREHAALQAKVMAAAGIPGAPGAAGPTPPGPTVPGLVDRLHAGSAPQAEKLSSHQAAITGKLPNAPDEAGALGGARGPM